MTDWQDEKDGLLAEFLGKERIGVVCDVDGTLSPIVDDPAAASVRRESVDALNRIQPQVTLLAFVSGRGAADIHERVGVSDAVYVGNHGMEHWQSGEVVVNERVSDFRPNLERVMEGVRVMAPEGVEVEDKGASASVHYRRMQGSQQEVETLKSELEAIAGRHDIEVHSGKMVYELRPPVEINKGTAFRKLVKDHRLEAAIYIGDDVTDVDALRMAAKLRDEGECFGLGVGVRHTDDTPETVLRHADLLTDGVEDVSAFLDWLSKALSASST